MEELIKWLEANKIQYKPVDAEVVEIVGMGKMYCHDMSDVEAVFRNDGTPQPVFNGTELVESLLNEGIKYNAFKFGDNFYYFDATKGFAFNILKYVGERVPCKVDVPYVNLGVHTPFDLLNGSFMPDMWVKKAQYLGQTAIGVCDTNTMGGLFVLQKECEAAGVKPVFGYSLTFTDGVSNVDVKVYVQTQEGLRNLLRIQKAVGVDADDHIISLDKLKELGDGNILVMGKLSSEWMVANQEEMEMLNVAFEDVYYQLDLSEYKAERIDVRVLNATKFFFDHQGELAVEPVLICDCYYLDKDDAGNKIILNKIATGAAHDQSDDQYFKDLDELYKPFAELIDPSRHNPWDLFHMACHNTTVIAEGAVARFETDKNFMPRYDMTPEEQAKYGTTHNMFLKLLDEGLERLVPEDRRDKYRKQMEYEIYVIESTDNVDYLLMQYDTVNWCRKNGIAVGCGRGSAAGCLLLYLLGITLIDPIKYNLIFERFILPERAGLYKAKTTVVGQDIESCDCYEITFDNGVTVKADKDAVFMINDKGKPSAVNASQLSTGDDVLFDNKDKLFTINEL